MEVLVRRIRPGAGGPCTIVSASGRADVEDGAWFRQLLQVQAASAQAEMITDLSRLSSMDWWTALILLWVARVIRRRGGTMKLAAPQPAVAALLSSADAGQVVPIYDTVEQAARADTVQRARAAGPQ